LTYGGGVFLAGFSQTATSGGTLLFSQPQQAQSTGGLFSSGASNTKFGTTPSVGSTSFGGFGSGSSAIGQNTANKVILPELCLVTNGI